MGWCYPAACGVGWCPAFEGDEPGLPGAREAGGSVTVMYGYHAGGLDYLGMFPPERRYRVSTKFRFFDIYEDPWLA